MTEIRHCIHDIDQEEGEGPLTLTIIDLGGEVEIGVDGYGTANGWDMPVVRILVEDGRLKVLVWSTLADEEPTVIDMEGAKRPRIPPEQQATAEDLAALAEFAAKQEAPPDA